MRSESQVEHVQAACWIHTRRACAHVHTRAERWKDTRPRVYPALAQASRMQVYPTSWHIDPCQADPESRIGAHGVHLHGPGSARSGSVQVDSQGPRITKTRLNKENKINPGILQQNFGSQSFELSVM